MDEVLHYLELKNLYYEKFYSTTIRFLKQTDENKWNDIEVFVDNRERILSIIRHFSMKIGQLFKDCHLSETEIAQYRPQVRSLHERRRSLAQKIVETDLKLISKIEELKSEKIKELIQTQSAQQQIQNFAVTDTEPNVRKTSHEA